jgi:uncharacterized protein (DUF302 family)
MAIVLLFTGYFALAQNQNMETKGVMIENESKLGFTMTVDQLSEAIAAKGWKITATHDLQETMKKNGKSVLPVKVIELCNPGHAFKILGNDKYRDVSPMLPCRISVYDKADGKTYISRMNAPAFASIIGGDAEKTILEAFYDTEEILKEFLK